MTLQEALEKGTMVYREAWRNPRVGMKNMIVVVKQDDGNLVFNDNEMSRPPKDANGLTDYERLSDDWVVINNGNRRLPP